MLIVCYGYVCGGHVKLTSSATVGFFLGLELVELSLLATAGWWDGLSVVLSGKVHEVSLVAEL